MQCARTSVRALMGGRKSKSDAETPDDDTPASTTQDLFGGRKMNRTAMPASMTAATRPGTRSTTVADTVVTLADTVAAALAPSLVNIFTWSLSGQYFYMVFLHAVFHPQSTKHTP